MKQANVSTVRIIDTLAEITGHYDRRVIEKSLLKTLDELYPQGRSKLYKIEEVSDSKINLKLLAYSESGYTESFATSDSHKAVLGEHVRQVIRDGTTFTTDEPDQHGRVETIYPAYDHKREIFAILVHWHEPYQSKDESLVHGIIKVYSNYLALLEKTQKDTLTGLYNRETLDEELTKLLVTNSAYMELGETEHEDRRGLGSPIKKAYAGLIDIDHFKSINDQFGHLFGDEILILVARMMNSCFFRKGERVYRYGGEEFVVILYADCHDSAYEAFDRLRCEVEQKDFSQLDQLTISVGFVEVDGQQTAADLVGQADKALYFAKSNGRNQVVSYNWAVESGNIVPTLRVDNEEVDLF